MSARTVYEWVVDEVDEHGDVVDVNGHDTAASALAAAKQPAVAPAVRLEVGLARNVYNVDGDLLDRQWAYLEAGALPTEFDGGAKVPARFRQELERALPR